MSINNENQFRKLIENSANNDPEIACAPIPDDAKRMLTFAPQLSNLVEEKVYDLGLLHKGIYAGIELKNETTSLTFNTAKIEDHQIRNLKRVVSCGGLGFVLLRFKKGLTKRDQKRLKTTLYSIDKAFCIGVEWIKDKSLPIELLIDECVELPFNIVSQEYDLRVLWQI